MVNLTFCFPLNNGKEKRNETSWKETIHIHHQVQIVQVLYNNGHEVRSGTENKVK